MRDVSRSSRCKSLPIQTEKGRVLAQNAKAEALGPRHNIALLPQVAAEPWLSRVIQDAAAAEEAGWFWHYRLNGLKAWHCSLMFCGVK